MKSENKKTSVLMLLIFPSKNAFWNQRKLFQIYAGKKSKKFRTAGTPLEINSAKLFVNLITLAKKCFKKEICRILGFE